MMVLASNLRQAVIQDALQGHLSSTASAKDYMVSNICSSFSGEEPYCIPETWKWCAFSDVIKIATNLVEPTAYPNALQIAPDYIEKGTGKLFPCNTVLQNKVKSKNHLFSEGQIIYSKIRPELRKAVIAPFPGLCSADMYPLETNLNKDFVLLYLLSDFFTNMAVAKSAREKMPKINQKELNCLPIPVPPLKEQEQIVVHVNALMQQIDEYADIEQKSIDLKAMFPEKLRLSILQAALQGKLTERRNSDTPVEKTLSSIRQALDNNNSANTGRGKSISEEELSNVVGDLPDEWLLCRLYELTYTIPSKKYQIQQKEILREGKYPVVSQSVNLIEGYSNEENKLLENEDIIIVFGDHSKTIKYVDFSFIVGADGTKLIVPVGVNKKYLYYALQYNIANMPDKGYARHFGVLRKMSIPLPPIEEQERIVERLDNLLPLCDGLADE